MHSNVLPKDQNQKETFDAKPFFHYFPMVKQWNDRHTETLLALFIAKAYHPELWHPRPIIVVSKFPVVGETGFYRTFQRHVYGDGLHLVLDDIEEAYRAKIAIFDRPSEYSLLEVADYKPGEREINPRFDQPSTIISATSFIEFCKYHGEYLRSIAEDTACIYIPNRVKIVDHPSIDNEFYRLLSQYADAAKAYYLETIEQIPPVSDYV